MSSTHIDPRLLTLLELTQIPTAAGREQRVIRYIERWTAQRPHLSLFRDCAGNLMITRAGDVPSDVPPLFITAHLDHPAFVVERIISPTTLELSFRGGVMDIFFENAPILVCTGDEASGRKIPAVLVGAAPTPSPAGKHYLAEISGDAGDVIVGDIAVWDLPAAEIDAEGIVHTHACDDLAAAAAALCAFEALNPAPSALGPKPGEAAAPGGNVRLLFTRAEEIGFIGAIAACKLGTIPRGSRVVALENSRSFADSPIGGGPIIRVGDRLSVFTPWLTTACAKRAEELTGAPASPTAAQTAAQVASKHKWQRKLMAGGACEASVFCAYGYDATCLCLPLGNYHNMPHLTELQAGTYDAAVSGPPRAAREYIAASDYLGLVDLLVAIGENLPSADPIIERVEKLYADKSYVLTS